MANKIVGNVYVIDSQTGVTSALQPGSVSWLQHSMKIGSVVLWAADTTGIVEFVFAADSNTTAIKLCPSTSPTPISGSTVDVHFGDGQNFEELRCKTLTAGTAWIYFV